MHSAHLNDRPCNWCSIVYLIVNIPVISIGQIWNRYSIIRNKYFILATSVDAPSPHKQMSQCLVSIDEVFCWSVCSTWLQIKISCVKGKKTRRTLKTFRSSPNGRSSRNGSFTLLSYACWLRCSTAMLKILCFEGKYALILSEPCKQIEEFHESNEYIDDYGRSLVLCYRS